jgi:hypothetical protein
MIGSASWRVYFDALLDRLGSGQTRLWIRRAYFITDSGLRQAPVRRPSKCLDTNNQSRYLAGSVSGIAAHSSAVAMAEAAARIRKPSHWPSSWKIKPVAVVLIEAAIAIRVPTDPRTKLNRPVPVGSRLATSRPSGADHEDINERAALCFAKEGAQDQGQA